MAIIQLKNVEVTRVNSRGYGVQVVEKWESKGKTGQQRYTVWFDQAHGLQPGQVIDVSGLLGAKVGEPWTGNDGVERRSVELSVNQPRIGSENAAQGQPGAVADSWNTPNTFDGTEPF